MPDPLSRYPELRAKLLQRARAVVQRDDLRVALVHAGIPFAERPSLFDRHTSSAFGFWAWILWTKMLKMFDGSFGALLSFAEPLRA